jgi:hypothetical protein
MLSRMTPEEFDERWAHWFVEPWGKEMEVASAVGAMILNAIYQASSSEKIDDDKLLKPDHFMPKRDSEEQKSAVDCGDFMKVMRARIGV